MNSQKSESTSSFVEANHRWMGPRGRRILHTSAWSMVAKLAAAANLFLTVPFVLHTLGPAQFGAWATLVSLVMFAGFLDFGFGNGTMNLIAAAHGRGANADISNIMREGYRTLLWIAFWLAAVVLVATPFIPWYLLLGMPQTMANSSRAAATAVLLSIVLAVPLNLANRVQLGLGRGDRAFRWQAIGQSLTTVVVIALAKAGGTLAVLTAASVATPLCSSIANTIALWRDPVMAAASPAIPRQHAIARKIRSEGLSFFVLQLAAALAYSADLPLISALRGPTEAGTYAIVQRLFSIVSVGLSLVWAPLWPIYRHALASGDHKWVTRTFYRSVLFAVVVAVSAGLVLATGFHSITHIWLHRVIPVSGLLLSGFAVWCVVDAIGTALGTFLNAASILRYQLIFAPIFACASLTLKAAILSRAEITALPWITICCYVLLVLFPIATRAKVIHHTVMHTKY
jgi:O-antigen/teichoic acid export membrane protein